MNDNGRLPDDARLGVVALNARDLQGLVAFYADTLGMALLQEEEQGVLLGAGERPLLRLVHRPNGPARLPRSSGLYHFAILLPSRRDLAETLWRLAGRHVEFQGFSDHLVSEAIYLADPEGNGIELYRDRPRAEWPYRGDALQMATLPLDTDDLLAEADGPAEALAGGTTIGHVHLHVGDLARAEAFYRSVIGFDLVLRYGPSAAFLSAGGYHHHLGLNVWAGRDVPSPPDDSPGLRWYELLLPDEAALTGLLERARAAGLSPESDGEAYFLPEPAGARIRVTVQTPA
ncbi:MAG: VOC family protein [Chloroflexi bacterium]|nr:VOC family protein [Chloroflexota bacterium]